MTPAEIERAVQSKIKVRKIEEQERALYDYTLAGLIVKGVSITLGSKAPFPELYEAYPGVFDDIIKEQEEERARQKMNLSALRFKKFAQSYNSNFNKEVQKKINE